MDLPLRFAPAPFLVAALACAGDGGLVLPLDGAADAGDAPACEALARVLCDRGARCSPIGFASRWRDGDRCAARMALACERETGATGAQISASILEACARKLACAGCADLPVAEDLAACDLRGRLTTGQACGANAQCASGVCVREDLCGICTARAAPGALCEHQDACAMGSSCVDGICERDVQRGAECDPAGTPCAAGLVCRASRCGPAAAAGEACRESDECDRGLGLFCARRGRNAAGQCMPVQLVDAPAACGDLGGVERWCKAGASCLPDGAGERCLAPAGDGEPCGDSASGRPCEPPARCHDSRCTLPTPEACR